MGWRGPADMLPNRATLTLVCEDDDVVGVVEAAVLDIQHANGGATTYGLRKTRRIIEWCVIDSGE